VGAIADFQDLMLAVLESLAAERPGLAPVAVADAGVTKELEA
jgi:hypothetical protein